MAEQAVGDIIKSITEDVKLLVRDEMELAKSELIPVAKNGGIGGGLFGAAGYFGICARSILYFAAAFGLVALRPAHPWLAFLIVGGRTAGDRRHLRRYRIHDDQEESRLRSGPSRRPTRRCRGQGRGPAALAAANAPQIEGTVVRRPGDLADRSRATTVRAEVAGAGVRDILLDGPWRHRDIAANGIRFHVAVGEHFSPAGR